MLLMYNVHVMVLCKITGELFCRGLCTVVAKVQRGQRTVRPTVIATTVTDLEKRSCQLFYYCVHMARKTTSLCYVSFYVRCSVFHLGYVSLYVRYSVLDLPTGGSRVLCTCTAAGRHCVAVQSVFGCACARNFLLWNCFLYELFRIFSSPGLAYFVSALLRPPFAEYYSMTGELTSSL